MKINNNITVQLSLKTVEKIIHLFVDKKTQNLYLFLSVLVQVKLCLNIHSSTFLQPAIYILKYMWSNLNTIVHISNRIIRYLDWRDFTIFLCLCL
jgi:hypothetical protein